MSEESIFKKAVAPISIIVCLVVAVLGLNKFFVPREVYQAQCEAADKRFNIHDQKLKTERNVRQMELLRNQKLYYEAREINLMQMQRYEKDPGEKKRMTEDIKRMRHEKDKLDNQIFKLKSR